jgi:dephospho-CoA kinase
VLRVGLTGGIGSGKSAVSARLAELGAVVIDADRLARDVVAPGTPGLAAVVAAFGPEVVTAGGGLDRAALGAIVFADPESRGRLNAIIHPLVRAAATGIEAAAPGDAVVVHDIPLLVETGQAATFDLVVVVDAPDDVRVGRLVADRGMDESDVRSRIQAQASRAERLAVADAVIDNSGPIDQLPAQVEALWRRLSEAAPTVEA